MKIYIDADACPVKEETFRVARRYELDVCVVSASWLRLPVEPWISLEVVKHTGGLDAADDWIVEQVEPGDIVISEDIVLASRCLDRKALPVTPRGREFTAGSIGEALAQRELMAGLREAGVVTGGPAPFAKEDRSRFLQTLDQMVNRVRRKRERESG